MGERDKNLPTHVQLHNVEDLDIVVMQSGEDDPQIVKNEDDLPWWAVLHLKALNEHASNSQKDSGSTPSSE